MEHYKEKLSAYLNHELANDERQMIAEHLLQCADCRQEHDQIKLGVALASQLQRADAPQSVWNEINNELDGKKSPNISLIPTFSFFNPKGILATAMGLVITFGLLIGIYFGLYGVSKKDLAEVQPTPQITAPNILNTPTPEIISNANLQTNVNTENTNIATSNANVNSANVNSNQPEATPVQSWKVETLAGKTANELAVGETLVTDANSRARVQVADIGNVEVAPNSRLKLVKTQATEHRLSLERGKLEAQIIAPPRLFMVDTPSAVAVDWGCAYTLEVDKNGDSKLHVTSGYVALERNGKESIVPAGAMAITKKGKGLGTPFSETATKEFRDALYKFDFGNGGTDSLDFILKNSRTYDTVTLWNLLSKVPKPEREKVLEVIMSFIKLPAGVSREGVLNLDKRMLEKLRWELETLWFA